MKVKSEWESLPEINKDAHEPIFLDVLAKHGLSGIPVCVPLQGRYTKGRKWTDQENAKIIENWLNKKSITYTSALLNRNPQDMIYKLLDYCKENRLQFTQVDRSEPSSNWNKKKAECAEELFESGLPAWKIAVIFRVDFEFVEKELFGKRKGYGHNKKNPFGINTDHKQVVNRLMLDEHGQSIRAVFEPFAGEGRFTKLLLDKCPITQILCFEKDESTFTQLEGNVNDARVVFKNQDNIDYFENDKPDLKFDLVDLDPFVTCHEQLPLVWKHLNANALLFLTFGGEYRRSFITTNRKSIATRYDFDESNISNSEYLEVVPSYFLGKVAKLAVENGFCFEVLRAVRYANNCRFWLRTTKIKEPDDWFKASVAAEKNGYRFRSLTMPRFREVRYEIDGQTALDL